jgi:hypothetical protein
MWRSTSFAGAAVVSAGTVLLVRTTAAVGILATIILFVAFLVAADAASSR